MQLSFPTKKLKKYVRRVNIKLKDTDYKQYELTVYGVTNKEGITVTGNKASKDLSDYLILKENQFVYNPYRVNVGSLGLAPKKFIGIVSPAYIVFETTEKLNAEFLYYYLKSSLGLNLIKWYGDRGGVRSSLRYNDLCEIDIPNLSLEQQIILLNKIKLINLNLNKFDNEISYQKKYISKLRQSIIQEAVQGKLVSQDPNDEPASVLLEKIRSEKEKLIKEGKLKKEKPLPSITKDEIPYELPNGWEWTRLGYVTDYGRNNSISPQEIKSDTWVLELEDIEKGTSKILQKVKYSDRKSQSTKLLFTKNDVLYCKLRPYLNKVVIADENGVCSSEIMPTKCYTEMDSKYLMYALKRSDFLTYVNGITYGTKMPRLGTEDGRKALFPLPPLNEQRRIIQKVDELMHLCDELEKSIQQSKKQSELLMQSVLQEAFKDNGEENNEISFGEFIKQKRKDKGITVTDMLKLLKDIKPSEYTKIEEGLVKPEKSITEKIAKALKLSDIETQLFKKLEIRNNISEYIELDYETNIAARKINKN